MQKLMLTAAVLGFMAVTAPARADDGTLDTPFYIGAGIGHISVDRGSLAVNGANDGYISGTGTAESLFGGYFFTDNFGAELAYHDYGSPTAYQQTGITPSSKCPAFGFSCPNVSGVTAEALGKLELVPQLDGILRAGFLEWKVGSPGATLLDKTSGNAFIYGAGVSKHFDYGLSFEITYERSTFSTEETRIGLTYSF